MLGGKWLQEATIHMPKNWSKPQPKASHYSSTLNIYGCFLKWWYPQIIHFNRVFHYKPSILGYHYFRKHPYVVLYGCQPSVHYSGTCIRIGNISSRWWRGILQFQRSQGRRDWNRFQNSPKENLHVALDFCQAELTRCRERAQCAADTAERVISDKRPKIDCFHFLVVFLVMIAAKSARPGGSSLRSLKSWSVWSAKGKTMRRTG